MLTYHDEAYRRQLARLLGPRQPTAVATHDPDMDPDEFSEVRVSGYQEGVDYNNKVHENDKQKQPARSTPCGLFDCLEIKARVSAWY